MAIDMSFPSESVIPDRAMRLVQVLKESEHVTELIKQSADVLSEVSRDIKQELADSDPLPGIVMPLQRSEAVETKLREALASLTAVGRSLEYEIRERIMLDHQLAAAREQEGGARHAAFHDALTGLPNRALFNDRLEHGIAQAMRHRWTLAVLFVDLDKFTAINDTYGHAAGDAVLRTIAKRLMANTRDEDTVSRQGGDEFLYLLTQIPGEEDIAKIAEKIIRLIQLPCNVNAHGLNVNQPIEASIGIAIFPQDGATADALIRSADAAMYRARQNKSDYAFSH
jgi:diguanylate cyclase (GGDEF)-like protein